MEFEVTANRKRPQSLNQLAGQEFVVSTLQSSIENGRIAHAYLFSGPRGVGKTSVARIFARSLNCMEGPTATPCGKCANCLEITKGNSMDVIEIDGASNTSVNDVREIKDEVLFAPHSSKYKIYIIDEVHMLSNSAFNALLKTIEEPPPYIIFVFATTEIHKVPATIRSRCQQFNFRLIALDVIRERLASVCGESGIEFEEDALLWVAKEGNGSLRDAYTLFDQVASFSDGNITIQKIREKLGLVGLDQVNELAELFVDGKSHDVLIKSDYILTTGVSIEQFVIELAEYFRSILFIKHGVTKESVLGYSPSRFSGKVLESLGITQLEYAISQIHQLHRDIRYSISPRFELELLFSKLSSLSRYITREGMLDEILELKQEILSGEVRAVKKKELTSPREPETPPKSRFSPPKPAVSTEREAPPVHSEPKASAASAAPQQPVEPEVPVKPSAPATPYPSESKCENQRSGPVPEPTPEVENSRPSESPVPAPEPVQAEPAAETIPAEPSSEPRLTLQNLGELKEAVIKTLRRENRALSATLERGGDWHHSDKGLFMFFANNFEVKSVSDHIPLLKEVIYDITHEKVSITARTMEKAEEKSPRQEKISDNVRLVKETFRGVVIQGE